MNCDWIKIYDSPIGGTELNINKLYTEEEIYLDISLMPEEYELVNWKDLQGNILSEDVISLVEGGRYKTNVACGQGFVAYIKTKVEEICIVVVDCDETQGSVTRSEGYDICGNSVTITATPNCCHNFVTWSDQGPDRTQPTRTVTAFSNVNPYVATFEPKIFKILVDVNDSRMGSVTISKNEVICGDEFTITATPNEGFFFDRWKPDEKTEETRTLRFDCGDPTVYMAYFKAIPKYKLTYDLNYETTPQTIDGGSYIAGESITYLNVTRLNYTFKGWASTSSATTVEFLPNETGTYDFGEDKTLYAVWQENERYTIHYRGIPSDWTADLGISDGNYYFNESFVLPTSVPAYIGYTFQGWYIVNNSQQPVNPTPVVTGSYTMPNSEMWANAVWEPEERVYYTVTFVPNNGSTTSSSTSVASGSSITIPSASGLGFTKPNHTFTNWSEGVNTYSPGYSLVVNGNHILTANWQENPKSTIVYNINGGTGTTPNTQTVYTGTSVTLATDSGFSYTGCTFQGWSTNSSASVAQYNGGQLIMASFTGTIVLYAIWAKTASYRVTYHTDETCDEIRDDNSYGSGQTVTVQPCPCLITSDCQCIGWSTIQNSTEVEYTPGSTFTITQNMDLFPVFDCCFVTFETTEKGSILMINEKEIEWGSTINIYADGLTFDVIPPEGCCFIGWFDNKNCEYLQPCEDSNVIEYLLVPADCVEVNMERALILSDIEFIQELVNKQRFTEEKPFIYNKSTGEMRQGVYVCKDEVYDFPCDSSVTAMFDCGTYVETDEEGRYVNIDQRNYNTLYDYLRVHQGEVPSSDHVYIIINGVERRYIYTPCIEEKE